jgi:hypothetical protein
MEDFFARIYSTIDEYHTRNTGYEVLKIVKTGQEGRNSPEYDLQGAVTGCNRLLFLVARPKS